jgi:hypothetical protein
VDFFDKSYNPNGSAKNSNYYSAATGMDFTQKSNLKKLSKASKETPFHSNRETNKSKEKENESIP